MRAVLAAVEAAAIGRAREARALVLAAACGQHCLMVGPPGAAKSLLCRALAGAVRARYFEILCGSYTTPDEVFGPPDLAALAAGDLRRRGEGYLQAAEIAFLDELFRAGPGVLGALLSALNERIYHEGGRAVPIPLRHAAAATNEWPADESLSAVLDRFLVRLPVGYVSGADRERVIFDALPAALDAPAASVADLDSARAESAALPYSAPARAAYLAAVQAAEEVGGARLSDRRVRAAAALPRVAAWLDGAAEVAPRHVADVWPALWAAPESAEQVRSAVLRAADPDAARRDELLAAARVEAERIASAAPAEAVAISARLTDLARDLARLDGGADGARYARREAARAQCRALGIDPASDGNVPQRWSRIEEAAR
ncbi:MAG: AAA family ATPase [Burkholderiaceae bacterium]|nr:AAA family ATPase [Burkholderiaceae bacterium]